MRLALLGYGKMGRALHEAALERGHLVIGYATRKTPLHALLSECECALDFSSQEAISTHVEACLAQGKNLVIGTTGWEEHLPVIKERVSSSIGVLYVPNFSPGIHLFWKMLSSIAPLFKIHKEYEAALVETHHKEKRDAPSGTAKEMARLLSSDFKQPPIQSLRLDNALGTHQLILDSPFDTLSLSHEVKSREGFALGAIKAAEWLVDKRGFYTWEDLYR